MPASFEAWVADQISRREIPQIEKTMAISHQS
jgi:hypothetical protein